MTTPNLRGSPWFHHEHVKPGERSTKEAGVHSGFTVYPFLQEKRRGIMHRCQNNVPTRRGQQMKRRHGETHRGSWPCIPRNRLLGRRKAKARMTSRPFARRCRGSSQDVGRQKVPLFTTGGASGCSEGAHFCETAGRRSSIEFVRK